MKYVTNDHSSIPIGVEHPGQPALSDGHLWFTRAEARQLVEELCKALKIDAGESEMTCECGSENFVCLECDEQVS